MCRESTKRQLAFESLLDVDGFLCAGLEIWNAPLRLTEGHCTFRRDLDSISMAGNYVKEGHDSQLACSLPHQSYFR